MLGFCFAIDALSAAIGLLWVLRGLYNSGPPKRGFRRADGLFRVSLRVWARHLFERLYRGEVITVV